MSVIASTIPTGPGISASSDYNTVVQILTLKIVLKTLGPPPQGFLLFTDSDQHRCISMVGEREDRVDLDYDPEKGIVAVTRPIGRGGVDIRDRRFRARAGGAAREPGTVGTAATQAPAPRTDPAGCAATAVGRALAELGDQLLHPPDLSHDRLGD